MPNLLQRALLLVLILAFFAMPITMALAETGQASWYGPGFCGRKTASGERFNCGALTCARPGFRAGQRPYWVRVTNTANGRSARCKVNDKGPVRRLHRVIDVSPAMRRALGMHGLAHVRVN